MRGATALLLRRQPVLLPCYPPVSRWLSHGPERAGHGDARLGAEVGRDLVSLAQDLEAAAAILPFRPRSLPRPFLRDVANGRFNFAVPVTDVLIGGLHFNLTRLRKPFGEGVSEQTPLGPTANVHQHMKVSERAAELVERLADEDAIELFDISTRPDT